jgi:hypothetical protein
MGTEPRRAPARKPKASASHNSLPFKAAVAFAPVAHAQVPATPEPSRPLTVILVLRDQTRYELPAAAGYHMPALDRLAQQGISSST